MISVTAAACLGVMLTTSNASALGPVDIEVAAKAGGATSPLSEPGVSNPPSPLGYGVGGRAGLALRSGFYFGGSIIDYFAGSESQITAPDVAVPKTVSTHTLMYGAELGYGIKLLDLITVRPQLGFGDATLITSTGGPSTTFWYLEPGVTSFVDLGLLFVGADANMLLFPYDQFTQAAFSFHAQVGLKF